MSRYSIKPFKIMFEDARVCLDMNKTTKQKPWMEMYRITYTNFLKMQGKTASKVDYSEEVVEKNVNSMYRWYEKQYRTTAFYASRSRTTSTETFLGFADDFDSRYNFDKPYAKTMFLCYLTGKPIPKRKPEDNKKRTNSIKMDRPTVAFIMHLAVAFKFTSKQCNEILQSYGHFPLHAKNVFHLAVYCVLRDIEKTEKNKPEFQTDFKQFHRLKELYRNAIEMLRNPDVEMTAYLKSEPKIFVGKGTRGPTTQLMEFVQKTISSEHYLDFILRHKNEFNEQHSKIKKEYSRLINILLHFFDENIDIRRYKRVDENTEEGKKAIEEQQRIKAMEAMLRSESPNEAVFNIDDCRLLAFIQKSYK